MFRGLFVTGTDTGVGKTVACAAMLSLLRGDRQTRYWKPIQTGIEQDDDSLTVRRLSGCEAREVFDAGVRLVPPVSPHLAAQLTGITIEVDDLLTLASAQPSGEQWIVEGAGGALVPINDNTLMVDLIARLESPVVVVARSGLGTINHTLLTLAALRARRLQVTGVIMVGAPDRDNRLAIEHYGGTRVIGELPFMNPLTPAGLQRSALSLSVAALRNAFTP